MNDKCNIIRDILPLYAEGMVSEDTVSFVEEHLEVCSDCSLEYEKLREFEITTDNNKDEKNHEQETIKVLKKIRKKFIKKFALAIVILCATTIGILATLQVFPVYRVFYHSWDNSFTLNERKMLAYIGTPEDRKIANTVLQQAEMAFSDISGTYEENQEKYGLLGRYAFESHYFGLYFDAVYEQHSLDLWSAHFEEKSGYMWINYSQEAINKNGETVSGSWDIMTLWKLEKDNSGNWIVVDIKEHA